MKAALSVFIALAMFLLGNPPAAMAGPTCVAQGPTGTSASSCAQRLNWTYDARSATFNRKGERIGALDSEMGPKYDYVERLRCEGDTICGSATYTCPLLRGQRGLMYVGEARLIGADGNRVPGFTPLRTTYCDYPGQSVPLAAVEAAAHEEISKRLSAPTVASSPPGTSLVGLLTIFSTPPQPEPSIQITTPVPGEIRAVPAYTWDFGDGLTGVGPGLAYQSGDLPSKLPGKYLGATYASGGLKHVVVTVTWSVQFRLEGVVDVPLAPIVFTASEDKQIATARAVLVNGS